MLGYRVVREADYRRLQDRTDAAIERADALHERLLVATHDMAAAQAHRDALVTRINQLEQESATIRHKLTGLPTVAPQIERGSPLRSSEIGAQVDLFEDVGDDKAREMTEKGLLHDTFPIADFPSAATLSAAATAVKGT